MTPRVLVLTREGCHLCDQAVEVVAAVCAEAGEAYRTQDVDVDPELRRTYTDIGVPIQLPHGAPGKAILSMLPREQQDYFLSRPIASVTPRTITDPTALRAELSEARRRGWAESKSERTPGIRAVAAPIVDHTGTAIGALGLSVPEVRMDDARADELGRRVAACAWQISENFGASPAAAEAAAQRAGGR